MHIKNNDAQDGIFFSYFPKRLPPQRKTRMSRLLQTILSIYYYGSFFQFNFFFLSIQLPIVVPERMHAIPRRLFLLSYAFCAFSMHVPFTQSGT